MDNFQKALMFGACVVIISSVVFIGYMIFDYVTEHDSYLSCIKAAKDSDNFVYTHEVLRHCAAKHQAKAI